jgi:hypothetical protein
MTRIPAPRVPPYGALGVIREKITFAKEGVVVDFVNGRLPAYASVVGGGVHILTAFNDSGTDTIDIGFRDGSSTDDPDAYATLLAATGLGFIALDELAAVTNIMQTKACIPTWRYNGENNNATAGVGYITLLYSIGPSDGQ